MTPTSKFEGLGFNNFSDAPIVSGDAVYGYKSDAKFRTVRDPEDPTVFWTFGDNGDRMYWDPTEETREDLYRLLAIKVNRVESEGKKTDTISGEPADSEERAISSQGSTQVGVIEVAEIVFPPTDDFVIETTVFDYRAVVNQVYLKSKHSPITQKSNGRIYRIYYAVPKGNGDSFRQLLSSVQGISDVCRFENWRDAPRFVKELEDDK